MKIKKDEKLMMKLIGEKTKKCGNYGETKFFPIPGKQRKKEHSIFFLSFSIQNRCNNTCIK